MLDPLIDNSNGEYDDIDYSEIDGGIHGANGMASDLQRTNSSPTRKGVHIVFANLSYIVNRVPENRLPVSTNTAVASEGIAVTQEQGGNPFENLKKRCTNSFTFPTLFNPPPQKVILSNISGSVPSAQLSAILGPTGSGKSSFLDILAMRKRKEWVSGSVFVNGRPMTSKFKRMSGYVVQTDILQGMMSVRENIQFSARLRLKDTLYSPEERDRLVEMVIEELGLTKCADTLVGNELIRGISGGEKKRTNIACELVTRPAVLFVDEPTTGLDASTSVTVVEALRRLTAKGCTVIMSIHQPRYSIFKLLDNILLLSNGKIIFDGSPSSVVPYFSSLGFVCDSFNNPADFMLDCLSGLVLPSRENMASVSDISGSRKDHAISSTESNLTVDLRSDTNSVAVIDIPIDDNVNRQKVVDAISYQGNGIEEGRVANSPSETTNHDYLYHSYLKSEQYRKTIAMVNEVSNQNASRKQSERKVVKKSLFFDVQEEATYGVGPFKQFLILSERNFLNIRRMPIILFAQLIVMVFFAVVVGGIYYQVDESFQGLQNRVGSFFFIVMSMIFANLSAIEIILKERVLFLHQRTNGYFSPGPYFLSTVLTDLIPLRIVPMFIYGTIAYYMMGYQNHASNFLYFQATLTTVAICSGALCYLMSALIGIFAIANLAVSVVYVVMMVFGGLLVNLDTLPGFLHWIQQISFFRHAYACLSITELHGLKFKISKFIYLSGDKYLEQQGFDLDDRPRCLLIMWTMTMVFLFLGYVALSRLRIE